MGRFSLHHVKTPGGFVLTEAASAFQKSIRRGKEDDALFWGTELDLAGYGGYAFKRMCVIASEDVGLAEPTMPATIRALYDDWAEFRTKPKRKKSDEPGGAGMEPPKRDPGRIFFVNAILLLVRAPKSRIVDHAALLYYKGDRAGELKREIPDYALDMHTIRGKHMKRDLDHFLKEGSRLERGDWVDWSVADPYRDRAIAALKRSQGTNGELFDDGNEDEE